MTFKDALVAAKLRLMLRFEMAQEQFEDSGQTDDDAVLHTDRMWEAASTLVHDVIGLVADDLDYVIVDELMAANEAEDGKADE